MQFRHCFFVFILVVLIVQLGCSTTTRPKQPTAIPESSNGVSSALRPQTMKSIQSLLAQKGFQPGAIDGIYGPKTGDAIRKFKITSGIRPVDGVASAELIAQLKKYKRPESSRSENISVEQPVSVSIKETDQGIINELNVAKEADEKHETGNEPLRSEGSHLTDIELPPGNPRWSENDQDYYDKTRELFKEDIRKCKNGVSDGCYYAGQKLRRVGDGYNSKAHPTPTRKFTANNENAIKFYRFARIYLDQSCEIDGGGCEDSDIVTWVIAKIDPYADEGSYASYIADAKKGDEEATKLVTDVYLYMHERMYQLGLGDKSGLQTREYAKLSSLQRIAGREIGGISKENTLVLMQILLARAEETRDVDFAYGVTKLFENSGFEDGDAEIDHFGQLAVAKAQFYFAQSSRGFESSMWTAHALLTSPHENVRKEAEIAHKRAKIAAAGAPPPRDTLNTDDHSWVGTTAAVIIGLAALGQLLPESATTETNKDYQWKQPPMNLGEMLEWVK